ncbi:MAG: acyl carrier protein [Candidatus Omnitrophica bacterium]|nr:acyl carrier protein [Candidatus Omnitrophota bacterium]
MGQWISQRLPWHKVPEPPVVFRASLWPKVHDILTKQLGVYPNGITPQADFVKDLGIDSLDAVELVMAVEEQFGIEITDEEAEKLLTVADLLRYLEQRMTNVERTGR